MEWNRSNLNGAVAPPQSQQYLVTSTSSMVVNGQSQLPSAQNNAMVQNGSFNPSRDPLLHNLLQAKTNEDFLRVQQAALGSLRIQRQTNPMKSGLHISSYKSVQETVPMPDNRSAIPVQNTVGSNYRRSSYGNAVHQTPQQQPPSLAIGQQFGGHGYNANAVQQPVKNTQTLQNYQPAASYTYPQQKNLYNSIRPTANTNQIAQNVRPSTMCNVQNRVSGPFISLTLPSQTNISAPMQDCRNAQSITSPTLANYRAIAPNMLSPAPRPQMSVPQLQTLPQLDGNANCSTQSQQSQNMQNNLISNSPQISASAAAKIPPPYQAVSNQPNGFNVATNQNFSKQRQNYVASNMQPAQQLAQQPAQQLVQQPAQQLVQQPAQPVNPPPVQSSLGDEHSRVHDIISSQQRKREMLKLLLIYRNVRQKYELLNQENNLLRQRLQANASQENAVPPPLLSSLPSAQPPANCVMGGQQNVTQTVPVQNPAQINSTRNYHSQNVYAAASNQAGVECNTSLQENGVVLNQGIKSENGNHLGQNNYSVFDGGQTNVANVSTSALQSQSPEILATKASQEVTLRELMGQTNSNHQYTSGHSANNGSVLQNGHHLQSLDKPTLATQGLNPAFPENSLGHLSSYTTDSTGHGQGSSLSREAIEASLPLWKSVPQNSSESRNRSSEAPHGHSTVDSSPACFELLDEITSGPTNEVSLTIPAQKLDLAVQNQANPQIAIVSPLVQSKEALDEDYLLSKVSIHDPGMENAALSGLINPQEGDCFNKILQALKSLGANPINNLDTSGSKDPQIATQDIVNSSSLLNTEASPQNELQPLNEVVDDIFQISGICTLVEGSSFYDSSIAMMFDEPSEARPLPHPDTGDDSKIVADSKIVDKSCILKAPCSTSPKADPVACKSEPVDEVAPTIESDLHSTEISCIDTEADEHMLTKEESCCDLESCAVSDQLTELLTEFPYGIKNYVLENGHENTTGPSRKIINKPVFVACAASEHFEPVNECKASSDTHSEMLPSPSVTQEHVVQGDSEPSMHLRPSDEMLSAKEQETVEKVPLSTKDDVCEILCNSPVSDIQITILDQAEIPKIFPDENELKNKCENTDKCDGTNSDSLQEGSNTVEPKKEPPSLKDSTDASEDGTDKNLFCCLFSWLNLTNSNAPKCNCKQLESSKEVEPTQLLNNYSVSVSKPCLSPQSPEPTLQSIPNLNHGGGIGFEALQPTDRPPKLDPVYSDNKERMLPIQKPPKLERIITETGCVKKSSQDFTPQAVKDLKSTSLECFQSSKDVSMENNPVDLKNGANPSHEFGGSTFRRGKHQSSHKSKSHGPSKTDKLIVKTDFLKSKHSYKEKRRSKEKSASNAGQWTASESDSQTGLSKSSPGLSRKRSKERVEQSMSILPAEQSPDHQDGKKRNRQMSSPGVDRSGYPQGFKRRKEKESHFEKTRKVPTVQEYLERKRELCKKRIETVTEPKDESHTAEISGNPNTKRPLSPAKTNVTSKEKRRSQTPKGFYRKDRSQSGSPYVAANRRRKDLDSGQSKAPENKTQNTDRLSSKNKIYLSPCVSSRRSSCEGINLAKLQIRHSPDKPNVELRRSLEGASHVKQANSDVKNVSSPKMLEFKLYPAFAHGSPTAQDKAGEVASPKEKNLVEGIKCSKEAWCNSIPFKKRKMESGESQGFPKSPTSTASTKNYKPLEKNTTTSKDSKATFKAFKQMYHEKRSKSLDLSQGNS